MHWSKVWGAWRRGRSATGKGGPAGLETASTDLEGGEYGGWGAPVGLATCTMHMCVYVRVCVRVEMGSGCVWEMCVCEKIPIARCTCIPEGRSVRLARLRHPVVARCRPVIVEVGRSAGRVGPREAGGRRSGTEVC